MSKEAGPLAAFLWRRVRAFRARSLGILAWRLDGGYNEWGVLAVGGVAGWGGAIRERRSPARRIRGAGRRPAVRGSGYG